MPVDANIALGIRPVEQVNMLGQMAQAMQIRQANQEYEDTNALREISAKYGGNISSPEFLREVGMQNPKYAADLRTKALANDKTTGEIVKSRLETSRELLSNVRTPEEYLAWHQGNHKDPLIGPLLASKGITADTSMATIQESLRKPGGFEELLKRSAMGLEKFYQDQTSRRNADTTSGAGYLQAGIARERLTMEQAEQANIARILRGEPPIPTGAAPVVPMTGGGSGVAPISSGGVAPVAPPMRGTAPVVAPMSGAAPIGSTPMPVATAVQPNVNGLNVNPAAPITPNVNALTADAIPPEIAQIQTKISQLISSGSPKAIAAADALIKQHNLLMPTRQIVQNTKGEYNAVDQRTSVSTPVLDAAGKQLVGKLPPEQFETSYRKVVGEAKGNRDVGMVTAATAATDNLPKLYETLDQLKTSDAITGFGAEIIKNIEAAKAKFTGDIKAGKKVADTQILDAMLGSDVFPMIQSLGIGARGMDTPAEREYIRGVMTGTINMDKAALIKLTEIRKNIEERAINTYNRNVDNGTLDKFFETEGRSPQKIDVPTYTPKTTTPQSGGGVRVSLPDGRSVTLPNAEAAAKFKKDAGIQ